MARPLVIGSRGSKLALWQAEQARERLKRLSPGIEINIEIIKTTGDVKTDPLSVIDIPALIRETGDSVEITEQAARRIVFLIEKAGSHRGGATNTTG